MLLRQTNGFVPYQPNNPTDSERDALSAYALRQLCRPEDFEYVKELTLPPQDITSMYRPGEFKGIKVGIVGGGLAGLAATFELRKLGFNITVFEALKERVGGRVYTHYFDRDRRFYGEFGPMRIPVTHETTWHYINLFDLNTRPFVQTNENAFIYLRRVRVRNDFSGSNVARFIYPRYEMKNWEKKFSWQQLKYHGLDSPLLQAPPGPRSEIIQTLPEYSREQLCWDAAGSREIMQSACLSEGAINLLSNLAPLAGNFLYRSYNDFVQEDYSADTSFLYEIPGGISRLPYAFHKSLLSDNPAEYKGIPLQLLGNVEWKSGANVKGIYKNLKTGRVTLEYDKDENTSTSRQEFDFIVCALPFSTLRSVNINPSFSFPKMQAIKEAGYGSAQKTLILFKKRFWEEGSIGERIIGGGSYTDLPISTVWYPSDHAGPLIKPGGNIINCPAVHTDGYSGGHFSEEPGVLIASYSFDMDAIRLANTDENYRFEYIKRELEEVHGLTKGFLDSIALDMKTVLWDDQPTFRGTFCYFTPGQKQRLAYTMTRPEYDERVFFAGEHISSKHRWMQGALKSGMEAANQVSSSCKRLRMQ